MTSSMVVPVIDVQYDNFKELWPAMVVAIKTSSFVALDTELSGLGNRKSLLAESIEDRYKAICHAARSRSILSLGVACYKKLSDKTADTYLVQVYNLTLLCSEEYIIEPQSVQFLVQHGFDFNKQYAHGIPYCKGNNKAASDDRGVHIRALFTELLRARKPLVLHNGLIDMAFLYQCFYAHLPERLATFTADLSEMFPAGIYDTKYVTEFEIRLAASYLEYAYKKCKLDNSRSVASGGSGPHVHVEFCQYAGHMSSYVDYRVCPSLASVEEQTDICLRFSDEKSKEDKRKKRKRQRNKKKSEGELMEDSSIVDGSPKNKVAHMEVDPDKTPDNQQGAELCHKNTQQNEGDSMGADSEGNRNSATSTATEDTNKNTNTNDGVEKSDHAANTGSEKKADAGTHRAGFDAFMTGFIFAYSCTHLRKEGAGEAVEEKEQEEDGQLWLPNCLNKVYLSGKAAPLNVVKSTFSKSSKAHIQKMEMVWGGRV
ncbi:target of EGR1 protein 1 isoform X2 [Channa argus]|uniref:target of EGR1 protein 1 isoform X2 n=1 Tax=Channa argus TaxID=215402 RepID=UPI003522C618